MAVIIARQKMTVVHAGGEHTIFPSADPQSLPDHLLDHQYVKDAVVSMWIIVIPPLIAELSEPEALPYVLALEMAKEGPEPEVKGMDVVYGEGIFGEPQRAPATVVLRSRPFGHSHLEADRCICCGSNLCCSHCDHVPYGTEDSAKSVTEDRTPAKRRRN